MLCLINFSCTKFLHNKISGVFRKNAAKLLPIQIDTFEVVALITEDIMLIDFDHFAVALVTFAVPVAQSAQPPQRNNVPNFDCLWRSLASFFDIWTTL